MKLCENTLKFPYFIFNFSNNFFYIFFKFFFSTFQVFKISISPYILDIVNKKLERLF